MNISPTALTAQYDRAVILWPFIHGIEAEYGLPPYCLFAVGSRETNLTNERGDGDHGHGVWQEDDRWNRIPPGFDQDVRQQATTAAGKLAGLIRQFGEDGGYDAYNSGRPVDADTTGKDYGPDVLARRLYLSARYGVPIERQGGTPIVVSITSNQSGDTLVCGQDKDGHPLVFVHIHSDPWNKWEVFDLTDAVKAGNTSDPRLYTVS